MNHVRHSCSPLMLFHKPPNDDFDSFGPSDDFLHMAASKEPIKEWHVADKAPGSAEIVGLGKCLARTAANALFCIPVSILRSIK